MVCRISRDAVDMRPCGRRDRTLSSVAKNFSNYIPTKIVLVPYSKEMAQFLRTSTPSDPIQFYPLPMMVFPFLHLSAGCREGLW